MALKEGNYRFWWSECPNCGHVLIKIYYGRCPDCRLGEVRRHWKDVPLAELVAFVKDIR